MIELRDDTLCVSFPEVHEKAHCRIAFQRTLRVPDDNQDYPLPAGLGRRVWLARVVSVHEVVGNDQDQPVRSLELRVVY